MWRFAPDRVLVLTTGSITPGVDDARTTGATQGVSLIVRLLGRRGHHYIAVEDPSNAIQCWLLKDLGLSVVEVPVDWQSLEVDVFAASPAQVVICTSAHLHPTGVIMSASRREQLCRWAPEQDTSIIEDDYASEFSFGPVVEGCVQGMVPPQVALIGSVSKSLAPRAESSHHRRHCCWRCVRQRAIQASGATSWSSRSSPG